jgi:hypothetical protein
VFKQNIWWAPHGGHTDADRRKYSRPLVMRANGTIARAWRESGYINKRTESWMALN